MFRTAKKSTIAPAHLILNESGAKCLAFGMQWVPLVSLGKSDEIITLARSRGANQAVIQDSFVGYTQADLRKIEHTYAAAPALGRYYGGNVVFVFHLHPEDEDDLLWFAVVRNGVCSIDEVSIANVEQAAQKLANTLADDDGRISYQVISNLDKLPGRTLVQVTELFDFASDSSDRLKPLSSSAMRKWVIVLIGLIAFGISAYRLAQLLMPQFFQKPVVVELVPEIPPEQAWAPVIKTWQDGRVAPSASPPAVRASLGDVPTSLQGWNLKSVLCLAGDLSQAPSGTKRARTWSCQASYVRSALGALNRDLLPPPHWAVVFTPLNDMVASWSLPEDVQTLDIVSAPTLGSHMRETVSKLQQLRPAFSDVKLNFEKVTITPPRKSDGSPYERLASLDVAQGQLKVSGPLRTMDALWASGLSGDWRRIEIVNGMPPDFVDSESAAKSALTVNLEGVIYANR